MPDEEITKDSRLTAPTKDSALMEATERARKLGHLQARVKQLEDTKAMVEGTILSFQARIQSHMSRLSEIRDLLPIGDLRKIMEPPLDFDEDGDWICEDCARWTEDGCGFHPSAVSDTTGLKCWEKIELDPELEHDDEESMDIEDEEE